jgi:hypothetical protein
MGRLMLGEFNDWQEFLAADVLDLQGLPRKKLKSGKHDIQKRLSGEIQSFCKNNFTNMTVNKLENLYNEVKKERGLEIPLPDFERKYSKFNTSVLKDIPPYSTASISLWGLKFRYPEHFISSDLRQSLMLAIEAREKLNGFNKDRHKKLVNNQKTIKELIQQEDFANRSSILSCFNLLESYLNGLAWIFARDKEKMTKLSNNKRGLIEDNGRVKFRDKLIKYPEIITGHNLWREEDEPPALLLLCFKKFRDSIVHPSPFLAPERFGGHDKLQIFYSANIGVSMVISQQVVDIIGHIHRHVNGSDKARPAWLDELAKLLEQYEINYE